jgi:hypothetical protein
MYSIMHRTQILLDEWQYDALKARADREGRSISSLLRDMVSLHLGRREGEKLELMEGVAEGPPDLAAEHDRYLYGEGEGKREGEA